MILPPFFIPKIIKNTSGNGPETIPFFGHLFSPFLVILDLLLGALFGAKRDFGLLFCRTFFRRLPPVSFFFRGGPAFSSFGGIPTSFFIFLELFYLHFCSKIMQNHSRNAPRSPTPSRDRFCRIPDRFPTCANIGFRAGAYKITAPAQNRRFRSAPNSVRDFHDFTSFFHPKNHEKHLRQRSRDHSVFWSPFSLLFW